jgi:hypothetical protein
MIFKVEIFFMVPTTFADIGFDLLPGAPRWGIKEETTEERASV